VRRGLAGDLATELERNHVTLRWQFLHALTRVYNNLYILVCWTSRSRGSPVPSGTSASFPADARRNAGFELRRVQQGLDPDDWKPMSTIGPGVREIRIHTDLEHGVFYVATFADAVYVLHAFEKRTRKTAKRDLDLARDRFRALVTERRTNAQQR
jgi:phage-related protein